MKTFSFCSCDACRHHGSIQQCYPQPHVECECVCVCACAHVCISCVCARMQVCGHLCVGGVNVCVCVCVLNQYSNLACCLNWMLKDFGEDFINVNYVSMYSMYVCNVCKTNQWKKMVKKKKCCLICSPA